MRHPTDLVSPDDLQILQRVFDNRCVEHGFLPNSNEALATAQQLFRLFKSGYTAEDDLLDAMVGYEFMQQTH